MLLVCRFWGFFYWNDTMKQKIIEKKFLCVKLYTVLSSGIESCAIPLWASWTWLIPLPSTSTPYPSSHSVAILFADGLTWNPGLVFSETLIHSLMVSQCKCILDSSFMCAEKVIKCLAGLFILLPPYRVQLSHTGVGWIVHILLNLFSY